MSREIKFRVWDKNNSEMIWFYELANNPIMLRDSMTASGTLNIELMQYTGLKDKNGKEIYEGDILNYDNALFKVVFIPGEIGMKRIIVEKAKPTYRLHKIQGEIIGNIYKTPELLKNKNNGTTNS